MKSKFVITWTEHRQNHQVIWDGIDYEDALKSFYESYDDVDREGVSNVEIYFLCNLPVNTEYKGK